MIPATPLSESWQSLDRARTGRDSVTSSPFSRRARGGVVGFRDLGKVLAAVSAITFVVVFVRALVFMRLVWLASQSKSYGVGFDLSGLWKMWGGWILLWLLITGGGFIIVTLKRS